MIIDLEDGTSWNTHRDEITVSTELDDDLAGRLVDAYHAAAQRRADDDDVTSWVDWNTGFRWRAVVRACRAERVGPTEIVAIAPDTPDGRLFGYVASDMIDSACEVVDPDGRIEAGVIEPVVDRQRYRFTWVGA